MSKENIPGQQCFSFPSFSAIRAVLTPIRAEFLLFLLNLWYIYGNDTPYKTHTKGAKTIKAKRIVSILLTGSMLLSLLPVSALAAAPVFENRGLISSGTYSQPVHNSGIISGGTFQAGVNNSGNISGGQFNGSVANNSGTISGGTFLDDVSNSDTISNGTFQGNVGNWATISGGTFQGNVDNWGTISNGTFQENVYNHGTISNGTFQKSVTNSKTISDGIFQGKVANFRTISGGTFEEVVEMNESTEVATIEGGTFKKDIELNAYSPTITDGLFDGKVSAAEDYSGMLMLSISGGLFTNAAAISTISPSNLSITGGYFVNKPALREGNDIAFTSVSDQDGRAFQVPVNKGWSEGYETLYVPSGSSEQPNTITVKTAAPLTDCLADDVSIMDSVQANADGSYAIDVHSPASIVLVTEESPAPPQDDPGGELDPGLSSGAAALGIVLGTAGLGYITYVCGSSLYLHYVLPDGFIPSTRQELATVLWTTAGKPDPVSTALYTDIPADAIEQQKAACWCAEQGLLSDHGAAFGPDTKVTNARIIRAWNSLKKVPVTIK